MKDLGPLHFFLGIEVTYFTGGIHLNQSKYTAELLSKTSMALAKPISTPLAQKHGLQEAVDNPVDVSLYRSIVGSLHYLTLTRPDIAHAVNLARANCVSWISKKQHTVARSSAEAEYRALASTTVEMTWITYILNDIGVHLKTAPTLFCDNLSALCIIVNSFQHNMLEIGAPMYELPAYYAGTPVYYAFNIGNMRGDELFLVVGKSNAFIRLFMRGRRPNIDGLSYMGLES
ncbi:uncharacterized mitochondrial protein AtMg00810-like [Nicotiana sylvestris]|uniref:uncharacterized mitochondrial protein AtMg00810-like n=1 Tax=Nicotiana sylvestris TaxID=4096 RepID=UPI00388C6F86